MIRNMNCGMDYPVTLEEYISHQEKVKKYSFSSGWCPTCHNSLRRRTQSETVEPCRKKYKDMKPQKKYLASHEYENMDLEYELKGCWYDIGSNSCRIRSNLCELPTSYINNTNNCQVNPPVTIFNKMSTNDRSDFVNSLENSFKNYEQSLKLLDYTEHKTVSIDYLEKCPTDRLRNTEKLQNIQSHYNTIVKVDDVGQTKITNKASSDNHIENEKRFNVIDSKFNPSPNIIYDTHTYFDKQKETPEPLNALYAKEMDYLRNKLKELKSETYKNQTSARMIAESLAAKDEIEENRGMLSRINSPRFIRPSKPKVISVKTKSRLGSAKLRRTSAKAPVLITSQPESENLLSDYSDTDESIKEDDEDSPTFEISSSESSKIISVPDGNFAAGDTSVWPIRESLFPHVSPYILFNTFDAAEPRMITIGRKFFKWKLSTITPILVRKVIVNSGFVMVRKSNQWLGTWGKHIKSPMFKTLKDYQKLNHFPGTFQLGRKDRLWRNFQRLINAYGLKEFGFLPHTFVLPQELKQLKLHWDQRGAGIDWWIIKPPASARGVGIRVINKWSQLPKKTSLVVQKYITQPYLINGSKFDLRLYVLVTSFHPLRVYLYGEGLVRFASVKYSNNAKDSKEKYMHLTNYSINKLSSHYTANEDAFSCQGHKWTISKLLEYLSTQGVNTKVLWRDLETLVIKTMIACEPPITELCTENMNNRYNCYELFGVDVLLDNKLKPWLLEVNISPSLHSSSPLDEYVKGPLVQSMFNMVQFQLPSRLLQAAYTNNPRCFEPKLFTMNLTQKEINKHNKFVYHERRSDYLEPILDHLTGDDIRHLIQAEDELQARDKFKRIFPTASTYKFLNFMEPRYYNRLFDAWETKYEKNREAGIRRLQDLCSDRVHLKGASCGGFRKNGIFLDQEEWKTKPQVQNEQSRQVVAEINADNESVSSNPI